MTAAKLPNLMSRFSAVVLECKVILAGFAEVTEQLAGENADLHRAMEDAMADRSRLQTELNDAHATLDDLERDLRALDAKVGAHAGDGSEL